MLVWLGPEIQPQPSTVWWWPSISCLPPTFSPRVYEVKTPPLFKLLSGRVFMVRSDYKTWVQIERSSVLTCCHMDLWLYCGYHLIIIISNNVTSSSSPGKRVSCLFQLFCHFAHSIILFAAWSHLLPFPWASLAQPPCLTTPRTILSKWTQA